MNHFTLLYVACLLLENIQDIAGLCKSPLVRCVFNCLIATPLFSALIDCSPISTYGGRGTSKSGLSREAIRNHAIIHMSDTQPARLASETFMVKRPITVDPGSPDQKLDQMSRLNFGKIYTVEHNVKVMNVGKLSRGSMPFFVSYAQASLLGELNEDEC